MRTILLLFTLFAEIIVYCGFMPFFTHINQDYLKCTEAMGKLDLYQIIKQTQQSMNRVYVNSILNDATASIWTYMGVLRMNRMIVLCIGRAVNWSEK